MNTNCPKCGARGIEVTCSGDARRRYMCPVEPSHDWQQDKRTGETDVDVGKSGIGGVLGAIRSIILGAPRPKP